MRAVFTAAWNRVPLNGLPSLGLFAYDTPLSVPASPFPLGFLAVAFFTTCPCSSIGAHAVMVCVVVTQADVHSHLVVLPCPFPVTLLSQPYP